MKKNLEKYSGVLAYLAFVVVIIFAPKSSTEPTFRMGEVFNGSHDGAVATCWLPTEDGVTENLSIFHYRCAGETS